jgi:mannose-6-phosphate isomerase-like protein (cupin superfamily)
MVLPPNVKHGFRVTGEGPLKTYGVHASPNRLVDRYPEDET